ncbi:MAG: hypothetical protein ACI8VC_002975 [Candidatus Endobugula sp.]|jgi:hypothetical protein
MAESAALLVDDVLSHEPICQWMLGFPFQRRFLFANRPELMRKVWGLRKGNHQYVGLLYRRSAGH